MNSSALPIAVTASLSFISTFLTLSTIFAISKYGKRQCKIPIPEASSLQWTIIGLLFSDMIQAIAGQLSYAWLALNIQTSKSLCITQAVLLAVSDLAGAFWATLICLLSIRNVLSRDIKRKDSNVVKAASFAFCWGVPIGLTLSTFAYSTNPFAPAENSAWCFISPTLPSVRIWHHYIQILICICLNVVGYSYLYTKVYSFSSIDSLGTDNSRKQSFTQALYKLAVYPIMFAVLFTPIVVERFLEFAVVDVPGWVSVLFFAVLMLTGLMNSLYFSWRNGFGEIYRHFLTRS